MSDIRTNHLLDELMSQPSGYAEGDKAITVGNAGTVRGYSYYATAIYVARPRKKDGKLVWIKECLLSDRTAGMSGKVVQRAKDAAEAMKLPYIQHVRQYQECNPTK